MPRGPLVLAAVGVLLALTATQVTKKIKENRKPSRFDGVFELLAPNLWRQGYHWANLGGLVGVDVYTFLIKADGKYILIDAGAPTNDAAEVLLKGLDDVMNGSKLQLIMLTHGHPDHCGALPALVKAYPGAQVVFHEEEAPYLLGGARHVVASAACRYACTPLVQVWLHSRIGQRHSTAGVDAGQKSYRGLAADSLAYKALVRVLVPENNLTEAVPASKALLLRGDTFMMWQSCWQSGSLQHSALAMDPNNAS